MKIPNILTITRFALIPLIIYLLTSGKPAYILLSLFLFLFAILTDWADGFIARHVTGQMSVFGTFMDPLVDKILILSLFFVFADLRLIPLWIVLLILLRELFVTGIRQVCSKPKKIVGANWMGKSKFILQSVNIVYLQFVVYLAAKRISIPFISQEIGYYLTLTIMLISIGYALNFFLWYRKELTKDI
jgi:CDP-diacylglycerol--glycerol-3-phosphate 3-phosphatidyltransferase